MSPGCSILLQSRKNGDKIHINGQKGTSRERNGEDEVVVKVKMRGICGTDLKIFVSPEVDHHIRIND
jgi:threonine dehydrogenase-like Zn-dependent dehydrogenase